MASLAPYTPLPLIDYCKYFKIHTKHINSDITLRLYVFSLIKMKLIFHNATYIKTVPSENLNMKNMNLLLLKQKLILL